MNKLKKSLSFFALASAFFTFSALGVSASDGGGMSHDFVSGSEFGAHVSEHAQMGHLGKNMNPGTHHKGFSPWAPGN